VEREAAVTGLRRELEGARRALAAAHGELSAAQARAAAAEARASTAAEAEAEAAEAARAQERLEAQAAAYTDLLHRHAAACARCDELEAAQGAGTAAADEQLAALAADAAGLRAEVARLREGDARWRALKAENNRLFNEVQDLKGNIRVLCRVRPLGRTGDRAPSCLQPGVDGSLAVWDGGRAGNGAVVPKKVYRFDRVFTEACGQAEVYEDLQPLTRSVMDGAGPLESAAARSAACCARAEFLLAQSRARFFLRPPKPSTPKQTLNTSPKP
jgi:kinesin family protein C2/C3